MVRSARRALSRRSRAAARRRPRSTAPVGPPLGGEQVFRFRQRRLRVTELLGCAGLLASAGVDLGLGPDGGASAGCQFDVRRLPAASASLVLIDGAGDTKLVRQLACTDGAGISGAASGRRGRRGVLTASFLADRLSLPPPRLGLGLRPRGLSTMVRACSSPARLAASSPATRSRSARCSSNSRRNRPRCSARSAAAAAPASASARPSRADGRRALSGRQLRDGLGQPLSGLLLGGPS